MCTTWGLLNSTQYALYYLPNFLNQKKKCFDQPFLRTSMPKEVKLEILGLKKILFLHFLKTSNVLTAGAAIQCTNMQVQRPIALVIKIDKYQYNSLSFQSTKDLLKKDVTHATRAIMQWQKYAHIPHSYCSQNNIGYGLSSLEYKIRFLTKYGQGQREILYLLKYIHKHVFPPY